ncbi:MAG: ATP-binding protein [Candidatus Thorarchaeota archaeon]
MVKDDSGFRFSVHLHSRNLTRVIWVMTLLLCSAYILGVYILPFFGLVRSEIISNRFLIELVVCSLPVLSGAVLTYIQMDEVSPSVIMDDEFMILSLEGRHVGTICLKITSVSGSLLWNDEAIRYNTAPLLAIRAGIKEGVDYAFQYGVQSGEPFLHVFISMSSTNVTSMKEILKREATRAEAILLSSLENVSVRLLQKDELVSSVNLSDIIQVREDGKIAIDKDSTGTLLIINGIPKVTPTETSSQVGTFISTSLRQGYSLSLTCVFSKTNPGKEKRRLERKWRRIKSKEKRNEDSLSDQAMKRTLLSEFEEINTNSAWFESSVYVVINHDTPVEGVKGLIHSIWSGDDSLSIKETQLSQLVKYRLVMKRHLKGQRIHVNRLVAYVNTPVQHLPVVSAMGIPEFQIPSTDIVENELEIGWAVYGNRRLSKVGLKPEWLREHMAVLGATGTGKTTLVKKLMSEITIKTAVPWWIFDVKGSEYSDLSKFDDIVVLRPGLDPTFVIDLIERRNFDNNRAHSTFSLLRELIQENSTSELSPAMEKLLREAVLSLANENDMGYGASALVDRIQEISGNDRVSQMTRDALLNRLEILTREPLGSILAGGADSFRISELLSSRVVFDLRYVSQIGGMDAARLLYNLVAKRIFDASMRRGISSGLHHLVVLEEASNLVPESYTRHSAADVTTGESMVMLQRATGQGVIVISTRPNISSNILANTSTKATFRLPYDSTVGGRFMSVDANQEQYLRTMQVGRALILLPNVNTFEIETEPFDISEYLPSRTSSHTKGSAEETEIKDASVDSKSEISTEEIKDPSSSHLSPVFDRIGELANHIIALLASREITTHEDIREFLLSLDARLTDDDVNDILRDLVSLSSIQREAIPLVAGGFIYSPVGKGLQAVKRVIIDYLVDRLENVDQMNGENELGPDLFVNETAIIIIPEMLKASTFEGIIERIRHQMNVLRNGVSNLIVIVRGSVAAAKLREIVDGSEEFDAVSVVSAFPSSLSKLVEGLAKYRAKTEKLGLSAGDPEAVQASLLEAVHDIGSASSRAVQMRLWFGLIQDFVDLSKGCVSWESILEFIDTTAIQSKKGRSAPLNVEEGKRALTELLADEMLVAVRIGSKDSLVELEEGLWIVNAIVLDDLKAKAISQLKSELEKRYDVVFQGHGYYDICADKRSYVVFPTQQELSTLIRLHSDVACRNCESNEVICILTAAEYLEDSIVTPSNLIMRTMDEGLTSVFI